MQTLEKNETLNTQVIQNAFAAFGRGDVDAIVELVTADVDWNPILGVSRNDVASAGTRTGKDGAREFFVTLVGIMNFTTFEPRDYVAQGDQVVAIGYYEATVLKSGKTFASEWVMVFEVRDGKISRFREFTDSKAITEAFR